MTRSASQLVPVSGVCVCLLATRTIHSVCPWKRKVCPVVVWSQLICYLRLIYGRCVCVLVNLYCVRGRARVYLFSHMTLFQGVVLKELESELEKL